MLKVLIFLILQVQLFSIVIISPNEVGLRPGLSGEVGLSMSNKRGNTDKNEYKSALYLSYDNNESYVTWLAASYSYGDVGGVENENRAYIHLRHIHEVAIDDLVTEFFVQDSEDQFLLTQRRLLGGAGLRYRIFDDLSYGRAYFGFSLYYEDISYTTDNPSEHSVRSSSYGAYTFKFGKKSRFSTTAYYQPKVREFNDYYLVSNLSLEVSVIKNFYLKFQLLSRYDSMPPVEVKNHDFTHETMLVWKFGERADR